MLELPFIFEIQVSANRTSKIYTLMNTTNIQTHVLELLFISWLRLIAFFA
jgi:hypothetical protein